LFSVVNYIEKVSIQLVSPASGEFPENFKFYKSFCSSSNVSIQLVSPASGENIRMRERVKARERMRVSIQLVSPASGELVRKIRE